MKQRGRRCCFFLKLSTTLTRYCGSVMFKLVFYYVEDYNDAYDDGDNDDAEDDDLDSDGLRNMNNNKMSYDIEILKFNNSTVCVFHTWLQKIPFF